MPPRQVVGAFVKNYFTLILLGSCLICGCGGSSGSPGASLSPTSLTFGVQLVGTPSQTLPVTLSNPGTAMLNISSITTSANFGQTNTCGSTLAPGANCIITVTFTPGTSGSLTGSLSVIDNAAASPQTVSLSGTGSSSGPSCSAKGQQCPPQFPPCCPGLTCVPASTRAFCE